MYLKQTEWKKKLNEKNVEKKEKIDIQKIKECTFKPKIKEE